MIIINPSYSRLCTLHEFFSFLRSADSASKASKESKQASDPGSVAKKNSAGFEQPDKLQENISTLTLTFSSFCSFFHRVSPLRHHLPLQHKHRTRTRPTVDCPSYTDPLRHQGCNCFASFASTPRPRHAYFVQPAICRNILVARSSPGISVQPRISVKQPSSLLVFDDLPVAPHSRV